MKHLFLANDPVMLGEKLGEQKELLAKEWIRKRYCDSFVTVQFLVTHSRCCPDA